MAIWFYRYDRSDGELGEDELEHRPRIDFLAIRWGLSGLAKAIFADRGDGGRVVLG